MFEGRVTTPAERRSSIWRSVEVRGKEENTARNLSSCVAMEGGAKRRVREESTGFEGVDAMKTSESFVSMVTKEGAIVRVWGV